MNFSYTFNNVNESEKYAEKARTKLFGSIYMKVKYMQN
jgi:hypothetical protein